jgi:hypothetical protein
MTSVFCRCNKQTQMTSTRVGRTKNSMKITRNWKTLKKKNDNTRKNLRIMRIVIPTLVTAIRPQTRSFQSLEFQIRVRECLIKTLALRVDSSKNLLLFYFPVFRRPQTIWKFGYPRMPRCPISREVLLRRMNSSAYICNVLGLEFMASSKEACCATSHGLEVSYLRSHINMRLPDDD